MTQYFTKLHVSLDDQSDVLHKMHIKTQIVKSPYIRPKHYISATLYGAKAYNMIEDSYSKLTPVEVIVDVVNKEDLGDAWFIFAGPCYPVLKKKAEIEIGIGWNYNVTGIEVELHPQAHCFALEALC